MQIRELQNLLKNGFNPYINNDFRSVTLHYMEEIGELNNVSLWFTWITVSNNTINKTSGNTTNFNK